jgi:hypothetical protein
MNTGVDRRPNNNSAKVTRMPKKMVSASSRR